MRDPMARSRRLTDGTRWRTFIVLLPVGRPDGILHQRATPGARANRISATSVVGSMRSTAVLLIALCLVAVSLHAQISAERIDEASFITVGGIDQWVTVRGDNRRSPVLLLLHGGPGDVQSPLVSTYKPYEKDFVLVQW